MKPSQVQVLRQQEGGSAVGAGCRGQADAESEVPAPIAHASQGLCQPSVTAPPPRPAPASREAVWVQGFAQARQVPAKSLPSLPGVVVSRGAGAHGQGPGVAAATVPQAPRRLGDSSPTLRGLKASLPALLPSLGVSGGQWASVPHRLLLHPTMSPAQGGSREKGRQGQTASRPGPGRPASAVLG